MLRKKLRDQYSNRLFVLLATIALALVIGWLVEYHHRGIVLLDYLDLSDLKGRSLLEIMVLIDPMRSMGLLFKIVGLIIRLLPAAIYNSLPVLLVLGGLWWLAVRFISTLYDTQDAKEAHQFLNRNTFGMTAPSPVMIVKEGHISVGSGSLYDRVGGRGLLVVYNDSAAVVEKGGRLVRVVGPSLSFLKPFERLWEVIDLRPQHWKISVGAMTKEGIPISCDVAVTFKIDDRILTPEGDERVISPIRDKTADEITDKDLVEKLKKAGISTPLPYTEEAVLKAATSIWVRIRNPQHQEQVRRWTGRVMFGVVEGTLRSILANYALNDLLRSTVPGVGAPPEGGQIEEEQTTREKIQALLEEKLKAAFPPGDDNAIGAKIVRVELGEIRVRDVQDEQGKPLGIPDLVNAQLLEAWHAEKALKVSETQRREEAELTRLDAAQEYAQALAQAEMVLNVTEALRAALNRGEDIQPYFVVTQFVEAMRLMAQEPQQRGQRVPREVAITLDELEKRFRR